MPGVVPELARRCGLDQTSPVQDPHPGAEREGQGEIVADEQDRERQLRLQRQDVGENLALPDDVESGGRLVHDQEGGSQRQGHRDHGPLAHAPGQLMGVTARSGAGEAELLDQIGRTAAGCPAAHRFVNLDGVHDLLADGGERVERIHSTLRHQRNLATSRRAQRPLGQRKQIAAVQQHPATRDHGRWQEQAR